MAKTAAKTKTDPATSPAAAFMAIPLSQIVVSPFEPQARRRARYVKEDTVELAASLALNGQMQPIKVRWSIRGTTPEQSEYEIVFGERRFLASKHNKAKTINAIVEDLDDEAAFRQQTAENDERQEPHPIDQATNYAFHKALLDAKRETPITVKEFAEIIGKPEKFVAGRLVLNNLIEVAQDDVEEGYLPLTLAREMAKFGPETQELIYNHVYNTEYDYTKGLRVPVKSRPVTSAELDKWIRGNVLLRLTDAPFDRKATDLREDGLACVNCPSRSGANASLFDKDTLGKNDSCLDMKCWEDKSWAMVTNLRAQLAADKEIPVENIPLVKTWSHTDGDGYLGCGSFATIGEDDRDSSTWCEFLEKAINIQASDRDPFGAVIDICRNTECETHYDEPTTVISSGNGASSSGSSSSSAASSTSAEDKAALERKKRKEELFDVKVGQMVRKRVFRQAAEKFGESVQSDLNDTGTGTLLDELINITARMRDRSEYPYRKVVDEILEEWQLDISDSGRYNETATAKIEALTVEQRARVLFLFTHSHKGAMYAGNYVSQKEVRALAAKWLIDYQLLDATERMNAAPKKEQQRFRDYQKRLEDGDRTAILPRCYTSEYTAKD